MKSSRIKGFHGLSVSDRREAALGKIETEDNSLLTDGGLSLSQAQLLVENIIGVFGLPLALAPNFLIDDQEWFIPMVTEEPSVVAAASNGARIAREGGGFHVTSSDSVTTCRILLQTPSPHKSREQIRSMRSHLLTQLGEKDPLLLSLGGGPVDLQCDEFSREQTLSLSLHVRCLDAMGANIVNTMGEQLVTLLHEAGVGRGLGSIITNGMPQRETTVTAHFPLLLLGRSNMTGNEAAGRICALAQWAIDDPYRAVTHNKGIMNGVTAVTLATGNDTRAQEAAAHFHAARSGKYSPLSIWQIIGDDLVGTCKMPCAVGTVGGMTALHPTVKLLFSRMGIKTARTLEALMVSTGLANNFAALWAIATEGIQRGHMALHAQRQKK
ncbi:hydroxymethylglutaryl-CoA reductase, degradative [Myxococcota bacterium]|nr:hydroxymethylglutaryl-CoA reductase, degradative [Myxococcota bacterium]MBU1535578.1 hydroxymethylglutaryl-CoA reductase, degradative [Myxococcota bacterium]